MNKIKVLLVDDHTLFREGVKRLLTDYEDLQVVGEATNGQEAVQMVGQLHPDVVLMDVGMPEMSGAEATYRIRTTYPETQVIMLTVSEREEDLFASVKAGARGYLLKNTHTGELVEAIRRVHAGEAMIAPPMAVRLLEEFGTLTRQSSPEPQPSELTERETEVLRLVAQGLGNKEIADRLDLSEHTVKTHLRHILEKLHLRSRAHAAAYAVQSGLIKGVDRMD
ncbi:MAG: DNA-binding response regulator [Nitrospinota bacterium]|nr:MAG: DNA-binding response regulator [Nitrospinota bacterium]